MIVHHKVPTLEAFEAARVLDRMPGVLASVRRFFRNIAAPATDLVVYVDERGRVVAAFAYLLSGSPNTGKELRTSGTYVARCARRDGLAKALWWAVRRRVGASTPWTAPTISRRGTAFVEAMRDDGLRVEEERKWPVKAGEASRYEARAFR